MTRFGLLRTQQTGSPKGPSDHDPNIQKPNKTHLQDHAPPCKKDVNKLFGKKMTAIKSIHKGSYRKTSTKSTVNVIK